MQEPRPNQLSGIGPPPRPGRGRLLVPIGAVAICLLGVTLAIMNPSTEPQAATPSGLESVAPGQATSPAASPAMSQDGASVAPSPGDGYDRRSAELKEAVASWVTLPDGWRPGLHPYAAPEARAAVAQPEVLAVAHDGSKTDRDIVPTLTVRSLGPLEPGGDPSDALDAQEQAFREGMERQPGIVTALERVQLPAGEAFRVELQTTDEGPQISTVQYFLVSRDWGYLSLWFACAESDLSECRSDFDAIAHSLLQ